MDAQDFNPVAWTHKTRTIISQVFPLTFEAKCAEFEKITYQTNALHYIEEFEQRALQRGKDLAAEFLNNYIQEIEMSGTEKTSRYNEGPILSLIRNPMFYAVIVFVGSTGAYIGYYYADHKSDREKLELDKRINHLEEDNAKGSEVNAKNKARLSSDSIRIIELKDSINILKRINKRR